MLSAISSGRRTDCVSGSSSEQEYAPTAAPTVPEHRRQAGRQAGRPAGRQALPAAAAAAAGASSPELTLLPGHRRTCRPRCGLAVTEAVGAEPPGGQQRERLLLCSAVTSFLPPPPAGMEQLERDPRSEDEEAEYEEEEVDPRIQVGFSVMRLSGLTVLTVLSG